MSSASEGYPSEEEVSPTLVHRTPASVSLFQTRASMLPSVSLFVSAISRRSAVANSKAWSKAPRFPISDDRSMHSFTYLRPEQIIRPLRRPTSRITRLRKRREAALEQVGVDAVVSRHFSSPDCFSRCLCLWRVFEDSRIPFRLRFPKEQCDLLRGLRMDQLQETAPLCGI